jgi:hypothetical protein
MRFIDPLYKLDQRKKRHKNGEWHTWFAWYPVRSRAAMLGNIPVPVQWFWLERIKYRWNSDPKRIGYNWYYEYRGFDKDEQRLHAEITS